MSDAEDMGAELTVTELDLLANAPALQLAKRSVSVKHPEKAYQSYEEGLAVYCQHGTQCGPALHTTDMLKSQKKPSLAPRRKIKESAIEFIEKEKEIYEEQTF